MPKLTRAVPVLTARDVAGTLDFWTTTLGFTQNFAENDFGSMTRDDVTMFVCSVQDQVVPDNTQAWVRVRDLDGLHAEWAKAISTGFADPSGPALTEITDRPWGREFALRDPAGNCVHFTAES